MSYDIISAITNGYDTPYANSDLIATNRLLMSDVKYNIRGWDTRIITEPDVTHPFNTIFDIRWHPFNYSSADYIVWVDGSLEVYKSLAPLVSEFIDSNADIALLVHPERTDIFTEYAAWMTLRNYPKQSAFQWMALLQQAYKCDIYHSGLCQTNIIIYKKTPKTIMWCNNVWDTLHTFDRENVDRLDQTIVTALAKTIKVYWLNPDIYTKGIYFKSHYNH